MLVCWQNQSFCRICRDNVLIWWPSLPTESPRTRPFQTPQMQEFNVAMSAVRISVEWLFGGIINYLKFVYFKRNLKIGLSSVCKMYVACAVLHNALTCPPPMLSSEKWHVSKHKSSEKRHSLINLVVFVEQRMQSERKFFVNSYVRQNKLCNILQLAKIDVTFRDMTKIKPYFSHRIFLLLTAINLLY